MLEVYSLNVDATADAAIPLNNVTIQKGCTAVNSAPATITLNKCGVYMVSCNASVADSVTMQLYKDGIAQPQAQGTGTNPSFVTLVQVGRNNSDCPCASPVTLQVFNVGDAATYDDINVVVTKIV